MNLKFSPLILVAYQSIFQTKSVLSYFSVSD